jgi:hypothetical protein
MNAPLVIEQAKALAVRPEIAAGSSSEAKIRALYRRVFARPPDQAELAAALRFLTPAQATENISQTRSQMSPIEQLSQVLLMANELMFVD